LGVNAKQQKKVNKTITLKHTVNLC